MTQNEQVRTHCAMTTSPKIQLGPGSRSLRRLAEGLSCWAAKMWSLAFARLGAMRDAALNQLFECFCLCIFGKLLSTGSEGDAGTYLVN